MTISLHVSDFEIYIDFRSQTPHHLTNDAVFINVKLQTWMPFSPSARTLCRECNRSYQKQWYKTNNVRHRQRVNKRKQQLRKENKQKLMVYLQQHPCVDCGEKDVVVLDFDHVVDNKVMEVSKLVNQYLWDMVEIEIAKCVVRCSNCHRRKTAKEQSWWRLQ